MTAVIVEVAPWQKFEILAEIDIAGSATIIIGITFDTTCGQLPFKQLV
jgi:hypothetical protein